MRVFDVANPDTAVHVRSRTTVPQQSLAVLNSPLVVEAAKRVAAHGAAREAGPIPTAGSWPRGGPCCRASPAARRADARPRLARRASASETTPAGFGAYERLAQAMLATAEFQFID